MRVVVVAVKNINICSDLVTVLSAFPKDDNVEEIVLHTSYDITPYKRKIYIHTKRTDVDKLATILNYHTGIDREELKELIGHLKRNEGPRPSL